jgi:F-type H+-transporting ATPase subunit a
MFRGTVTYRICYNVYDFVHSMVEQYLGRSGSPFFPYMLFIFYFILLSNVSGLVPGVYAVTSNLSVTFYLSMVSWLAILFIGLYTNRLHFFSLFMPPKIPFVLTPFLLIIETLSYTIRIASLSLRLFANIVAGHILLDCFTMFVYLALSCIDFETLSYAIITGFIILYSSIFLLIFELMVAFLQAYIFTVLTSIYLRDSIHISH